jgi:hypothetical protein
MQDILSIFRKMNEQIQAGSSLVPKSISNLQNKQKKYYSENSIPYYSAGEIQKTHVISHEITGAHVESRENHAIWLVHGIFIV